MVVERGVEGEVEDACGCSGEESIFRACEGRYAEEGDHRAFLFVQRPAWFR